MVDSLWEPGSIRDVLHTSGDPRDAGRRNSKGWTALFAKESLMCKTWSFATCALPRCNCDWSLGSYRSTTDLAVTMSPLAFHLAVFHVRRRRNWPVFSIDWAWPISFPSSSPKTPNFNSLLAGNVVEIYWNAQDDDKDGLCVLICLMLFDS